MIEVITCEQADESLPAYLLDALDTDEAVAVAAHLRTCENHREMRQSLRPIVDTLALAAPLADRPPSAIKQQLLSQVRATPRSVPHPRPMFSITRLAAFAVGVMIIVVLGAWAVSLQSQVAAQQAQLDRLTTIQNSIQQFMLAANIEAIPAKLTANAASVQAALYVSGDRIAMAARGLPVLTGEAVYQCWWMNDQNEAEPGKSFKVDSSGAGVWTWQMPDDKAYHILGITLENQSGLTQPQGPLILTAQY